MKATVGLSVVVAMVLICHKESPASVVACASVEGQLQLRSVGLKDVEQSSHGAVLAKSKADVSWAHAKKRGRAARKDDYEKDPHCHQSAKAARRPVNHELGSSIGRANASSSEGCEESMTARDENGSRAPTRGAAKKCKEDEKGILCYKCRRSGSTIGQRSIMSFCRSGGATETAPSEASTKKEQSSVGSQCAILVCRQCRRPMEESAPVSNANSRMAMTRTCPSISKLRGYKRVAAEKHIEWRLLESDAQRVMSLPCAFCGRLAADNPGGFNGINRVNHSLKYYDYDNIAPACADCNTMKHDYSSISFIRICRHVATFQGMGNFSLFPEVFRNASSRRGRRSAPVCPPVRPALPISIDFLRVRLGHSKRVERTRMCAHRLILLRVTAPT